ncbi:hypothetical protein EXN22_17435 [Pseudomonas tructae]|uniref:Uncharacterized protein n=1 Tax=Pseudomonas tructae TaxID=2518644 RepID=A0A411MKR3_9PSED|nr:hypothetical protein [Pseudomonas tructae]QBF27383.1 hypothetical protein EXN22_17435 [Pseudomonas tructae]
MISYWYMRRFIRRFYPRLISVYLLALFSTAMMTGNIIDAYFLRHAYELEFAMGLIALGTLVITLGTFILVGGRTWGAWLIVVLLVGCLFSSLLTYNRSSHQLLLGISLAAPLLGLLVINSRRYRQMCRRLVVIRRMRNRWIASGGKA